MSWFASQGPRGWAEAVQESPCNRLQANAFWRRGVGVMAGRLLVEDALCHPMRTAIVEAVRDAPGQGFRQLARRLSMAPGTLRHHLGVLARSGVLRLVPVGQRLAILPWEERRSPLVVALLCDPDVAAVRDFVAARGRVIQRQVWTAFPAPRSTTNNRLRRLADARALRVQRQGRCLYYEVDPDAGGQGASRRDVR